MVEYVLEAENKAIAAYTHLTRLADEMGELGIRIQMENFAQEENIHRDEAKKILEGRWQ